MQNLIDIGCNNITVDIIKRNTRWVCSVHCTALKMDSQWLKTDHRRSLGLKFEIISSKVSAEFQCKNDSKLCLKRLSGF